MSARPYRLIGFLVLALPAFGLARPPAPFPPQSPAAEPPAGGAARGAVPDAPPAPAAERWAVVIGINYDKRDPAWGKGPAELRNAENDAAAVKKRLVECYGYKEECVRLLLARDATKQAIEAALSDEFASHRTKVGKADSVLVYFSGHGYLDGDPAGGTKRIGYVFPVDIQHVETGRPNTGRAIEVEYVVRRLRDHCPAAHKLLVLDCCYSGSVFRVGVGVRGAREGAGPGGGVYGQPGFQAITAGAEETVPDGQAGGHSPFTTAFLRALDTIPQRRPGSPEAFSASELFGTVQADLRASRADRQTPEYGWIGEDQGEFKFSPAPDAKWPKARELDEKGRRQLLAVVPSTFGNWWADEMLWFMPALRYEIIAKEQPTRSAAYDFDPTAVRGIAQELAARKGHGAPGGYRYEHLGKLLAAQGVEQQMKAVDDTIQSLERLYPAADAAGNAAGPKDPEPKAATTADRALDLHYLAVLYQKRKRTAEADDVYRRALDEYRAVCKSVPALAPLHALCCMDYGVLCQNNLNRFDEAVRRFADARAIPGTDAPAPFVVFTLCREADAARRMGLFGVSDDRMKTARDRMTEIDRGGLHPMSGAVHKHDAWAAMEQCRFDQARTAFERSLKVFEGLQQAATNPFPYDIELFHVRHGLAMAERFQGEDEKAVRQFRQLTHDIAEKIGELDRRADYLPNYAEVRQLLCERYANSVDRQGDCRLYGRTPDYAEAADDYRRALRAVGNIPEDRREATTLDLLYRRAIALAMPPRGPAEGRNLALAGQLCAEAAALEEHLRTTHKVTALGGKTVINRAIARTLAHPPAGAAENELWNLIRPGTAGARGAGKAAPRVAPSARSLDRDEIERLMFGCLLLLENRAEWGLTDLNALECCDHMLSACRSATRPARLSGRADVGVLRYLRPYYDAAFRFKAEQAPVPVKELVEIAWEATQGQSYRKPAEITPVLAFYRAGGPGATHGFLLLDVPATKSQPGVSRCVRLAPEWNDGELLAQAAKAGSGLPLPAAMQAELTRLKLDHTLQIRWRDPVTEFGVGPPPPPGGAGVRAGHLTAADDPLGARFPFNLGPSLRGQPFSDEGELRGLGFPSRVGTAHAVPSPRPVLPTEPKR